VAGEETTEDLPKNGSNKRKGSVSEACNGKAPKKSGPDTDEESPEHLHDMETSRPTPEQDPDMNNPEHDPEEDNIGPEPEPVPVPDRGNIYTGNGTSISITGTTFESKDSDIIQDEPEIIEGDLDFEQGPIEVTDTEERNQGPIGFILSYTGESDSDSDTFEPSAAMGESVDEYLVGQPSPPELPPGPDMPWAEEVATGETWIMGDIDPGEAAGLAEGRLARGNSQDQE